MASAGKQHQSTVTGGPVKLRMVPDANNVLWSYKLQHNGSLDGYEYAQYQCLDGDQVLKHAPQSSM